MQSPSLGKLSQALTNAQKQIDHAIKDSVNPHLKSRYADLRSVIDAIKGPLAENGLSYVQYGDDQGEYMYLVTRLMHSSGEYIEGRTRLLVDKVTMQGLGSAYTYARRYGLSAMIGISQEDNDAQEISTPKQNNTKSPRIVFSGDASNSPTEKQLSYCKRLVEDLDLSQEEQMGILSKYGVKSSKELTLSKMADLITELKKRLEEEENNSNQIGEGF